MTNLKCEKYVNKSILDKCVRDRWPLSMEGIYTIVYAVS